MIELTKEQIERIEALVFAKNKYIKVSAQEVTALYNEVSGKKVRVTGCQTCLRNRINEMQNILNQFIEQENKKNEESLEKAKEIIEKAETPKPKKKAPAKKKSTGRKKKKEE